MKIKHYILVLATVAAFGCFSAATLAQIDPALQETLQTTTDESALINAISQEGEADPDVYAKNLACKRLAKIGTEASVPALANMLASEKLNLYARYALEEIPGDVPAAALRKAAVELKGRCAVGVIHSLGVRRDTASLAMFRDLLAASPESDVRGAIYYAAGLIANEDALALLKEAVAGPENDPTAVQRLGDAILIAANTLQKNGNTDDAAQLFESLVCDKFPVFIQKAGSYRSILVRGTAAQDAILAKLQGEKYCCFSAALKSIREWDNDVATTLVPAVISIIPNLPEDRKALVLRALGDRKDGASRKLLFPVLVENATSDSPAVKLAVAQAFKSVGLINPTGFMAALSSTGLMSSPDQAVLDALVETVVAMPGSEVDAMLLTELGKDENFKAGDDQKVRFALGLLKTIELRRVAASGPALVQIAGQDGIPKEIRDGALDALAEIVTLDSLGLLADAMANEQDDARADWILRAACTRLPREDCAKAVVAMFETADSAEKPKLLGLLKQIGGPTALACVEKACWESETKEAATAILGQWNTPDDAVAVADACLKLAKESPENKYRVRGIRSYIRIPRQFNLPVDQRLAMCRVAFDTATRPEDKVLVFDVFPRIVEVVSAQAAFAYASDANYREQASAATVAVAEKINLTKPAFDWKSANPDGAAEEEVAKADAIRAIVGLMKDVMNTSGDDALKARAQKVIERYP